MSNLHHRSVIARLQRHGRWLVDASPSHIRLTKHVGNQACSVVLERNGKDYMIKPVTYPFKSMVSHFDYNQQEERWARNKNAFRALVQTLKKCEVWGNITNQDFIQINENNKKSKKPKVKNELSELLGK